jgi:hypothetical protein
MNHVGKPARNQGASPPFPTGRPPPEPRRPTRAKVTFAAGAAITVVLAGGVYWAARAPATSTVEPVATQVQLEAVSTAVPARS